MTPVIYVLSLVLLLVTATHISPVHKRFTTPQERCVKKTPHVALGDINASDCGPSGATTQVTALSGPNGNIDWLNCGFETAAGWQPPALTVANLVTKPLSSSHAFSACSPYISLFQNHADELGLPPILLASFAMQESSCDPSTVGGGGEQGLMQITRDKCGGAPNGDCKDPDFNIRTAATYFAGILADSGGNILRAIGAYNGWHPGLTKSEAFAAANTSCCRCQNNGDYLHQFVNGWMQGINAYDHKPALGKYFNLNICG